MCSGHGVLVTQEVCSGCGLLVTYTGGLSWTWCIGSLARRCVLGMVYELLTQEVCTGHGVLVT